MAKELEQTRGSFKLKGLVKGIDRDNAYEEGVRPDGKYAGTTYRKLNIGLQTDPSNQVRLGLFSYEPEEVFMWNSAKKQKNKDYKGERIPFDEYLNKKEVLKENGTAVLQSRVGVEYDEKGKLQSEGLTSFEASEMIYDNIDNDDGAFIEGQISYSSFKNQAGDDVTGTNYNIDKFFKAKSPFDLDDEEYDVQNYYEQQFVYIDSMIDKANKKLLVTGRVIDYRKNTIDTTFVVNYGDDPDMGKLAKNINKKFKFGDLMTVYGEILNQTVETEVEDEEDDDVLSSLGGKAKPSYATRANVSYNREMTIDGVGQWEKGYYSVEDFEENGLVVEEKESKKKDDLTNELGGKSKKKQEDPFDDFDDEDPFLDSDDDDNDDLMPF